MNITYFRVFLGILGHYSIQYLNFAKKWFNSLFNSKNFKKIQFKKIFNSKICKKIQFKKIFRSKQYNSKKCSIQKFAKKFNSKFDSKCWIWQDSIQQYIHSITNYGYRSPLASTLQTDSSTLILSARSEHQQDRHTSRIGSSAAAHHRAVIWDFKN